MIFYFLNLTSLEALRIFRHTKNCFARFGQPTYVYVYVGICMYKPLSFFWHLRDARPRCVRYVFIL